MENIDAKTVQGFGDEWSRYDQSAMPEAELRDLFDQYFQNFPWAKLPPNAEGFDLGCGSGRWAALVAERVGKLHCVDASDAALAVAKRKLAGAKNCAFHHASVDSIPLQKNSMDFGYSLGVLHHVPNTAAGIRSCVEKLKVGAPFQLYLYYRFDNRPWWFRGIWGVSNLFRVAISRLPHVMRHWMTELIALLVYLPLARTAALLERLGFQVGSFPLSAYRHRSFYTMRTDARDRFGTQLEQRFTKVEIESMMRSAGLGNIVFSASTPFWCATGTKL